eukprot:Platyproteum_vivax@DN13576_c0_g1_i1.p1
MSYNRHNRPAFASNLANPQLDEVIKNPDNLTCIDCGQKAPRWASVNLGVLMCIECSGHHRNLGVHISQVKSLTLDTWKPQWLEMMKRIGNRIGNNFYEHKLPVNYIRPTQGDPPGVIRNWIEQKYVRLAFAPSASALPPHILVSEGSDPDIYPRE